MKIRTRDFRVAQGATVRLRKWPTRVPPVYETNDAYEKMLARHVAGWRDLQELLYASDQYTLLVIFQGMDTSGKDGAIKHVMSGVNPQGCQRDELQAPERDGAAARLPVAQPCRRFPERGCIGIFNRSYYEEVLVVRVHPELLRAEGLPDSRVKDGKVWKARYRSIVDLERHLDRCGTRVIKFFLHLSKDEQRERLLARLDDPDKSWKFNVADIDERSFWPAYMDAYESCLGATSTARAPWYIVPADDKRNARLIVSEVIVETLEKLGMEYPRLDAAEHQKLLSVRAALKG